MPNPNFPNNPGYNLYIGSRYVPVFSRENNGIWTNAVAYEPLTIVMHNGASFTSKTFVPVGIDINDTEYWALTGNYNAQIEQYRQEVERLSNDVDTRIAGMENTIASQDVAIAGIVNDVANLSDTVGNQINNIVLVFGDSWADLNRFANYPQQVGWIKSITDNNSNIYTFAVAGAKMENLTSQIQTAISDTRFNNVNVSKIVIICGVNDIINSTTVDAMEESGIAAYTTIKSSFKNAETVMFLNCIEPNNHSITTQAQTYGYGLQNMGFPVYNLCYYLMASNLYSGGQSNQFHLSDEGGLIMSKLFLDVVNGKIPTYSAKIMHTSADVVTYQMTRSNPGAATVVTPTNLTTSLCVTGNNAVVRQNFEYNSQFLTNNFVAFKPVAGGNFIRAYLYLTAGQNGTIYRGASNKTVWIGRSTVSGFSGDMYIIENDNELGAFYGVNATFYAF